MEAKHIRPITNVKDHDSYDILVKAINGDFNLFTVIKNDFTVHYDYCEIQTCPDTQEKQFTVQEMDESRHYPREEIIQLSIDALKELVLVKKIEGNKLALVFPPPTNDHKLHSTDHIAAIELGDIYYYRNSLTRAPTNKSPVTRKPHIQAIQAALSHLGAKASNLEIYSWIKKEAHSAQVTNHSFLNYLDFDDDGIVTFTAAYKNDPVLKTDEKTVTKKNFQSICSRERAEI